VRKALAILLSFCALGGVGAAVAAEPRRSAAPKAVLLATTSTETHSQRGRVIYSTWGGEHFDRSRPPIRWPGTLAVSGASSFAVDLPTQEPPFVVEIRAWKRIRRSGVPKGRPEVSECGPPTTSGAAGTCTLAPNVTPSGLGWRIRFDLKRSSGPYYVAVSAAWDNEQVAWINHLRLTRRGL
jgi:hypothetical protein